jgi:hypothetical protein
MKEKGKDKEKSKERRRKKRNRENRGQGNIDSRQSLWGGVEQLPREKGCFIKRGIVATE